MRILANSSGGVTTEIVFQDQVPENSHLDYARNQVDFQGKLGEVFFFPSLEGAGHMLIGLGPAEELGYNELREAFFNAGQLLDKYRLPEVEVILPALADLEGKKVAEAVAEGFLQSTYCFDKYLTEQTKGPELTVNLTLQQVDTDTVAAGIKRAEDLMAGVFLTRDLCNEPANVIYPETLAAKAKESLEPLGIKVTTMRKKRSVISACMPFQCQFRLSEAPCLIVME